MSSTGQHGLDQHTPPTDSRDTDSNIVHSYDLTNKNHERMYANINTSGYIVTFKNYCLAMCLDLYTIYVKANPKIDWTINCYRAKDSSLPVTPRCLTPQLPTGTLLPAKITLTMQKLNSY